MAQEWPVFGYRDGQRAPRSAFGGPGEGRQIQALRIELMRGLAFEMGDGGPEGAVVLSDHPGPC